jgi:HEAT repeat protein
LQALGALRSPESLEPLRRYIDHSSVQMRKHAVFNLAALGEKAAVPDLKKKLQDVSIEVRWNAAFGLAYFLGDASGVPELVRMLDRGVVEKAVDPKDPMREFFVKNVIIMAAQAVAAVEEKSALPKLREMASKDPSIEVQAACRSALKAIEP